MVAGEAGSPIDAAAQQIGSPTGTLLQSAGRGEASAAPSSTAPRRESLARPQDNKQQTTRTRTRLGPGRQGVAEVYKILVNVFLTFFFLFSRELCNLFNNYEGVRLVRVLDWDSRTLRLV